MRGSRQCLCGDRGGVVVVIAGHVGATRCSGIVSSAADVRGMRGVDGSVSNVYVFCSGGVGADGGRVN